MVRTLVTGASGWVGIQLVCELRKTEPGRPILALVPMAPAHDMEAARLLALRSMPLVEVREADLLSLEPGSLQESFYSIFHLAAHTATEAPGPRMAVNSLGTARLLDALGPSLKDTPFLFTGSVASIDCFTAGASGVSESAVTRPLTAYGKSKLKAENLLRDAAVRIGFPLHIVRAANVIGPGGFRPGGLFDVIQRGGLFTRFTWPGAISVIDVRDFARALRCLVLLPVSSSGRILHVARPDPVSIQDMIRAAGFRRRIRFPVPLPRRWLIRLAGSQLPESMQILCWRIAHLCGNSMVMNCERFRAALPDFTFHELNDSLEATYVEVD